MQPLPTNITTGIHQKALEVLVCSRVSSDSPAFAESQTAGKANPNPSHWPQAMSKMPSAKASTKTGMAMDNLVAMVATLMPNSWEHNAVSRNSG